MEPVKLCRDVYKGTRVRIYGRIDRPLFVIADIGHALGLKDIFAITDSFEYFHKEHIYVNSRGECLQVPVLTNSGLYELLCLLRNAHTKEFELWLARTYEKIKKVGPYDNCGIKKYPLAA